MADIVIADDDPAIVESLADALGGEGHVIRIARDGEEALAAWRERRPDLMILDVMMPKLSGYEVLARVRAENPSLQVLLLSAKSAVEDKVLGLGLGADDYVSKPVEYQEFKARVVTALRRARAFATGSAPSGSFPFGSHLVDPGKMRLVGRDGAAEPLTVHELGILRIMAGHPGEVVRRDDFFGVVWGQEYYGTTRTLDNFIRRLRGKLGDDAACIVTSPGTGYRYDPEAAACR